MGKASAGPHPEHAPEGGPGGQAHSSADRGIFKPDLCLQARQARREHSALRRARGARLQHGGVSPGERSRRFQEMAPLPELKCPGERGWLSRMWMKTGLHRKEGTFRMGPGWPGILLCPVPPEPIGWAGSSGQAGGFFVKPSSWDSPGSMLNPHLCGPVGK